jgi:hypothetical protein
LDINEDILLDVIFCLRLYAFINPNNVSATMSNPTVISRGAIGVKKAIIIPIITSI